MSVSTDSFASFSTLSVIDLEKKMFYINMENGKKKKENPDR